MVSTEQRMPASEFGLLFLPPKVDSLLRDKGYANNPQRY